MEEELANILSEYKKNADESRLLDLLSDIEPIKKETKDICSKIFTIALGNNHIEIIDLLLDKGLDPNHKLKNNKTFLHMAAKNGYIKIVDLLLSNGADVNAENKVHLRPLYFAAKSGHLDVAMVLINNGADITKNAIGPLLSSASEKNNSALLKKLLSHKSIVTEQHKFDALLAAVQNDSSSSVEILLESGVNLTLLDSKGRTILEVAKMSEMKDIAIIELLESKMIVRIADEAIGDVKRKDEEVELELKLEDDRESSGKKSGSHTGSSQFKGSVHESKGETASIDSKSVPGGGRGSDRDAKSEYSALFIDHLANPDILPTVGGGGSGGRAVIDNDVVIIGDFARDPGELG